MSHAVSIDVRVESGDWSALGPEDLEPDLRLKVFCSQVAQACVAVSGVSGSFALLLTDDATVQRLNAEYRGKDMPTDVLSFPNEPFPGEDIPHLGDVAIAIGVSSCDARDQKKEFSDHIAHLIIHGFLHLVGHDHIEDTQADKMEALEKAALASLGIADPYLAP